MKKVRRCGREVSPWADVPLYHEWMSYFYEMRHFVCSLLALVLSHVGVSAQSDIDHWEAVVQDGTEWRYLVPSFEPIQYWNDPTFNDEAWEEGPSGFGYGDGDDATVVPTTTSIYLRRQFTLDNLAAIEEAVFAMDYDDGYVAYLNGVEIGRTIRQPR